jgi:hypothetical protein
MKRPQSKKKKKRHKKRTRLVLFIPSGKDVKEVVLD